MVLYWKNYPAIARILANLSRGNPISQARDPIAAAGSHFAGSCWCWITFRESREIACLNTHENDSSEESFEAIKLAVMSIFGILKHLFEVCKTLSAHSNLSSHSGISDTFVMYTQSILLINWKQVAPKYL